MQDSFTPRPSSHDRRHVLPLDRSAVSTSGAAAAPAIATADTLTSATAFVRRNLRLILACLAATTGLAAVYLLVATPSFTAEAILYIDKPQIRPVQIPSATNDSSLDSRTIDSQVEILKSDAIAMSVVKNLQLADNSAFVGRRTPGLTAEQDAMRVLRRHLSVARVGLSAVIKIAFKDSDPGQAARIANAVAGAYIENRETATNDAAESAANWLEARLRDLQKKAADAEKQVQDFQAKNEINQQAKLSDLQATARTYRQLYDSFLQRYAETGQQQSFHFAEGQLVSPALPPTNSRPSPTLVLPIAIFGGLCLGLGLAGLRELLDRRFRTPEQIAERLEVDCLGALEWVQTPYWRTLSLPRSLPKTRSADDNPMKSDGLFSQVLTKPKSHFAETMRSLKFSSDRYLPDGGSRIIGFTSALPGEGKSTVAANFAQIASRAGRTVLLIDSDFRKRTLTRSMTPRASKGWCDLALGRASLELVLRTAGTSEMHFLPLLQMPDPFEASEFLTSESVSTMFEGLRRQYDYIVVDLPCLSPVIDVRASALTIDAYVLVVEWGKSSIEAVQGALASAQEVHQKLIGAVLNKTDLRSMRRYMRSNSECYFRGSPASF